MPDKFDVGDVLALVVDCNDSDLSGLSSDEDNDDDAYQPEEEELIDNEEAEADELTALDYFKLFWTDDLTDLVAPNNYSVQKGKVSVNTNCHELEQYIGIHVKMGIIALPSYTLYWWTYYDTQR
jgi:hypothetical protein